MKRTDPYSGPFPRKRHSHRCLGCAERPYASDRAVACYKSHCTMPQLVFECSYCRKLNAYTPVEAIDDYCWTRD